MELECAVLDDGTRVLTATSIFTSLGRSRKGMNSRLIIEGTKIPPFLASKNLEPLINKEIIDGTKLIQYKDGRRNCAGYKASLLPSICKLMLKARRKGDILTKPQEKIAIQCEILLTAFASVGIDALIDEASGYQYDRKHDALRILLNKYIVEELQNWVKTFPDQFFEQLDRLYENKKTISRKRPQYYANFINKYIYNPIEHGYVKKELDKMNIKSDCRRKARFHQWLSKDGKSILTLQIGRIMGLMESCSTIDRFKNKLKKMKEISIAPFLFNDMNKIDDEE